MVTPQTKKTRYAVGGTTEYNSVGTGFWTRETLPRRADDSFVVLTEQTAKRLGIVSHQFFGRDTLAWLILQYNNIIEPVEELYPGRVLAIPNPSRIF
jgi:hypothetical protein